MYCLLLFLLSFIIIRLKCLYYFVSVAKLKNKSITSAQICFSFLPFFAPSRLLLLLLSFGKENERKTSERQIVYNVGLWARGVNGWMCIIIKRQGILLVVFVVAVVACAALGIKITQIIT